MSTPTPAIDLSRLPAPDVIEALDYEALLEAALARLGPDYVVSEADPAYKVLEAAGYRELLLRQRVNDAARAVMLPTARGADLDNLAALLGVERQIVTPADPDAIPPVEAVYETDERLRQRAQLAPSAVSTAGPASSYRFHALSAAAEVLDVAVASPSPGSVTVTVLAREGNGEADADLLAAVESALNDESVRPLGDVLAVQSAAIVDYQVTAELTIGSGPDADAVLAAAVEAVTAYAAGARRIGRSIPRSALYAALHRPGVEAVDLTAPAADVAITAVQAAHATRIQVTKA
ncbi:MAG: baseplate J/gp47 family protein [Bryobacterales bacterium]|nr:baseplate J/gp47 family protein [Bryobacterales bacterium]MDE0294635.1 baseplate J/gp47 family protein [Bryobacterales bacterium]